MNIVGRLVRFRQGGEGRRGKAGHMQVQVQAPPAARRGKASWDPGW